MKGWLAEQRTPDGQSGWAGCKADTVTREIVEKTISAGFADRYVRLTGIGHSAKA
jgi:hypothetical protein